MKRETGSDKIDKINHSELLIRIDERTNTIEREIKELKHKLFGNGQEGICKVVDRHDVTLKNIRYGMGIGFTIVTIIILIANYFK